MVGMMYALTSLRVLCVERQMRSALVMCVLEENVQLQNSALTKFVHRIMIA